MQEIPPGSGSVGTYALLSSMYGTLDTMYMYVITLFEFQSHYCENMIMSDNGSQQSPSSTAELDNADEPTNMEGDVVQEGMCTCCLT